MSSLYSFRKQRRTPQWGFDMSKTWKEQPHTIRADETPQAAIDRLVMREAQEDIHEALAAPQEAQSANQ